MAELNSLYGGALTVPQSPLSEVGDLPAGATQETSPLNPVSLLPESTLLPQSPKNEISNPVATSLPASVPNPTVSFGAAISLPGFPSYLVSPASPAFSVRPNQSSIRAKVATVSGNQYRLVNDSMETQSGWTNSAVEASVNLLPNKWNAIRVEVSGQPSSDVKNFDINTGSPVIGDFVLHYKDAFPRYGFLAGGYLGCRLLDIEIGDIEGFNYWGFHRLNISAEVIDRMLVALDDAIAGPTNAALIYSNNPGSPDESRSPEGIVAMNSLLFKGLTITR